MFSKHEDKLMASKLDLVGLIAIPHLLFNLSCSAFGCLQVFNKGSVSKEVSSSRGEAGEEGVLQLLQLDLKVILLLCEFRLCVEGG